MEETQILRGEFFQTKNGITMPLSASGSGGIEASVLNSLEEGDEGIVAVNGVFSERRNEIGRRGSPKRTGKGRGREKGRISGVADSLKKKKREITSMVGLIHK